MGFDERFVKKCLENLPFVRQIDGIACGVVKALLRNSKIDWLALLDAEFRQQPIHRQEHRR